MARRTFPDPDRADSYFELLDDPVRPATVDRVALAESELRRLGLDDAEVRADGDTATVLLPGTALSTSPESVLESEVARAVRSAGFGSAIVVRVGGTAPDRQPGSGDPGSHDGTRHDGTRHDHRRDNKWQPVALDDLED